MTPPTKLNFQEWRKPEVDFLLHGWKPHEGLAFVSSAQNNRQVMRLVRPSLSLNGQTEPLAFPDVLPISIAEIRLVPPPCRADEAEAELLRRQASGQDVQPSGFAGLVHCGPPDWEFARLRYDDEILVVQIEDREAIKKALEQFLTDRQQEYEARKTELAELQALVERRGSIIGRARYYSDLNYWPAEAHGWRLSQERMKLESDFPRGCLKWSEDEARRRPRLRNPILRARWAKAHDFALEDMVAQRGQFLSTLPPEAAKKDVIASLGIPSQPDTVGRLLGYPQRYDPIHDLEESTAAFGASTSEQLTLCAQARFLVTFENQTKAWLAGCPCRAPQNQSERQEFGSGESQTVIEAITAEGKATRVTTQREAAKILSDTKLLKELAGEQTTTSDKWRENPLGSRESVADYLLTMDAMKIDRGIAAALVRFGYGDLREQCAETAGVSVATIKRALAKARRTPYASFFARNRAQKIKARGAMKKPDELYARLMQLAAKDPGELRAMTEQMIAKAQGESDGGNAWDKTVQGLS